MPDSSSCFLGMLLSISCMVHHDCPDFKTCCMHTVTTAQSKTWWMALAWSPATMPSATSRRTAPQASTHTQVGSSQHCLPNANVPTICCNSCAPNFPPKSNLPFSPCLARMYTGVKNCCGFADTLKKQPHCLGRVRCVELCGN